MGNLGAFINITGSDLTPQYKTYAAVVSILPPFRTKKSSKHHKNLLLFSHIPKSNRWRTPAR